MPKKLVRAWVRSVLINKKPGELFGGDDALFKKTVDKQSTYAEYGCGASTIWVALNVGCRIFSVDSSKQWIDLVKSECADFDFLTTHLADVGPVGAWGRPLSYEKCENFSDYTDWIWLQREKPNVVLIDGRFRVCCFLRSLIRAEHGTKILFDDYTNRPEYHFVERFVKPTEVCGRQALFIVPREDQIIRADIEGAVEKFPIVLD